MQGLLLSAAQGAIPYGVGKTESFMPTPCTKKF